MSEEEEELANEQDGLPGRRINSGSNYSSKRSIHSSNYSKGQKESSDSFLPQIEARKRSAPFIRRRIPTVKKHKYIGDTERLCLRIRREIEEDERKTMDIYEIMKNNEKMRLDIKQLNNSINKIIEKKRAETLKVRKLQKKRRKPKTDPNIIFTKQIENNQKNLQYMLKEEIRLDRDLSKIQGVDYYKKLEMEIDECKIIMKLMKEEVKKGIKQNDILNGKLSKIETSTPLIKKNKYLEDHLFLAKQLQIRNDEMTREIKRMMNRMSQNNNEANEIEINISMYREEAKDIHMLKKPVESEYQKLVQKSEKNERLVKITAKNFDVELEYGMNDITDLKEKNEVLAETIMIRKREIKEVEDLREYEMMKMKEEHEIRIKEMIESLKQELAEDEMANNVELEEMSENDSDLEMRKFLREENSDVDESEEHKQSQSQSENSAKSDETQSADDSSSDEDEGQPAKFENKLGLDEKEAKEYKVKIYNSNGDEKLVANPTNKKPKVMMSSSVQVEFDDEEDSF